MGGAVVFAVYMMILVGMMLVLSLMELLSDRSELLSRLVDWALSKTALSTDFWDDEWDD